jgi:heptosyltransferase I
MSDWQTGTILTDSMQSVRVLIVRVGAMGDVLHAMPAVAALREAHPDWFIGWVVEPRWRPLLQAASDRSWSVERDTGMPLVDRTYYATTREWKDRPLSRATIEDIRSLRKELRSEQFDLCVDMQGAIRSAVIGKMAGARQFAGPEEPREGPARWLYGEQVKVTAAHVVEQACELLGGAVGEVLRPAKAALPVDEFWEESCGALLQRLGVSGERFVLLAPTAGWGAKQWPADRFGAVAAALAGGGLRVLVNAAPSEDAAAQAVVQASEGRAVAVSGELSQLIALTRRASLVIAGDTGPLHLAAALERPVVALFGPTDPARNGPYGTRSRILRHGPERRDHRRLAEPEAGLLKISVDEVVGAALELLQG